MGKPDTSETVKNSGKPVVSRKVPKSGHFREKWQKRQFSQKLWGLGRLFSQKVQFWQVGFWRLENGSFRQVDILSPWLYPKEAWWTGPRLWDTTGGSMKWPGGVVARVVVPGVRVVRTMVGTRGTGPGHPLPLVLPCFRTFLWISHFSVN